MNTKITTKKQKIVLNLKAAKSLLKLINLSFWQSIVSPIMSFGFSAIFIGLFGYVSLYNSYVPNPTPIQLYSELKPLMIGVIALSVMSFAINSIPQTIIDYKSSVLLKRIGSTPIKPITFVLTISFYYFVMTFIMFFWALLWLLIWFPNSSAITAFFKQNENGTGINWGGLIFSMIYTSFISVSLAVLIVSISKSSIMASGLSMIVFFSSMFLSGQLFPISSIVKVETLNVLSYFTPFRYTTGLLVTSWNGGDIFNLTTSFSFMGVTAYQVYDKALNIFIPLIFVGLSILFSIKNFKWSTR